VEDRPLTFQIGRPVKNSRPCSCKLPTLRGLAGTTAWHLRNPLDHESVECVPQGARRTFDGDDLAVDWAVCVPDMFGLAGPELEHQQMSAVPAEDLGALILVSIPGRPNG
jgi:hypothetical protein